MPEYLTAEQALAEMDRLVLAGQANPRVVAAIRGDYKRTGKLSALTALRGSLQLVPVMMYRRLEPDETR
jgi:hypothetical protein